jgi:hypothetical protein
MSTASRSANQRHAATHPDAQPRSLHHLPGHDRRGDGAASSAFTTTAARACACGCSVFDVGGGLLPQGKRITAAGCSSNIGHSNQNTNWVGNSKGSSASSTRTRTSTRSWLTCAGFQYMFNREWGVHGTPALCRSRLHHCHQPGDRRAREHTTPGIWGDARESWACTPASSKDMSTGITFGLKLPTGIYTAPGIDRDSQIGTRQQPISCSAGSTAACSPATMPGSIFRQPCGGRCPSSISYAYGPAGHGRNGLLQSLPARLSGGRRRRRPLQQLVQCARLRQDHAARDRSSLSHRVHDSGDAADPLQQRLRPSSCSRPGSSSPRSSTRPITASSSSMPTSRFRSIIAPTPAANGGLPTAGGTEGQLMVARSRSRWSPATISESTRKLPCELRRFIGNLIARPAIAVGLRIVDRAQRRARDEVRRRRRWS